MRQRLNRIRYGCVGGISFFPGSTSLLCACLIVSACVLVANGYGQNSQPQLLPSPRTSLISPEANLPPYANAIMEMREQTGKKNFHRANAERKRRINEDSVLLLKLADELKVEMAETPQMRSR
jgi:hypothetical protein